MTRTQPRPLWANLPSIGMDHDVSPLFSLKNPLTAVKSSILWSEDNGCFTPHISDQFVAIDYVPEPMLAESWDGMVGEAFVPYEPKGIPAIRRLKGLYLAMRPTTSQIEVIISKLELLEETLPR